MTSTCSEGTDLEEEDLLNYLVVIVPERATGRDLAQLKSNSIENVSGVAASDKNLKAAPQSLQVSPLPAQKTSSDFPSAGPSARLLSKHPGGDRHPNPDYQTRAKAQADLAKEIRHGLEEYKKSVWRQRYSSYTKLGFDLTADVDVELNSSRTSSFTDLSGTDDYYPVTKPKVQLLSAEDFATLKSANTLAPSYASTAAKPTDLEESTPAETEALASTSEVSGQPPNQSGTSTAKINNTNETHSFFYPAKLLPPPPAALLNTPWYAPMLFTEPMMPAGPSPTIEDGDSVIPTDGPIPVSSGNAKHQSAELAEAAVAALLSEVSRAAFDVAAEAEEGGDGRVSAASHSLATPHTKRVKDLDGMPSTPRRVCGFYPVKVSAAGNRRRDELEVGYAFDITKKKGAVGGPPKTPRGSSYSFSEQFASAQKRKSTRTSDQTENQHNLPIVSMAR